MREPGLEPDPLPNQNSRDDKIFVVDADPLHEPWKEEPEESGDPVAAAPEKPGLWLRARTSGRLRKLATAGAAAMAVVLVAELVPAASAAVERAGWTVPDAEETRSVPGRDARFDAPPRDRVKSAAPAPARWPAAGTARVSPAAKAVPAKGLPVAVASRERDAAPVQVSVLDRAATTRAGVDGLLLRVATASTLSTAREATGPVTIEVDYSGFRHAYGGGWAQRLRLVPMPECALTTPALPECGQGDPVPTRNDPAAGKLSARVPANGLYAVAAAAGGSGGDYKATSLSPSAKWDVSEQSGDFGWTYEMDVPPSINGPAPELALSYSSASVDGRTAATNNQPSWVGEGFSLETGHIERNYAACADDGSGGSPKRGDLCWKYDNATMTLGGQTTELVRDDKTGVWRSRDDDGSRIERLTGAVNGDKDGEYWRVTTVNGTQYYFGRNRLPTWTSGKPETGSTWTVPVFGNNKGEPCYNATFASAWCDQAWRWNLDYVVDPKGNAMAYYYAKEENHYGRNRTASARAAYTRGGYPTRVEYGLRDSAPYAQAPMRVTFGVAERCLPSGKITCSDAEFTKANAAYWPDVPVDQHCASGTNCTDKFSPTFWTRKRLATVTTQVWGGSAYRDVDQWSLRQEFPQLDGSGGSLWLAGVTHTGKVGGTAPTPEVTFHGVALPNRVDAAEGIPPMVKYRLRSVVSESGGVTSVAYSEPDCTRASLPTPDGNSTRCYPTYWTPDGSIDPMLDWFHKYVVTSIVEDDRMEGSPDEVTSYEYLDGAAWHYDDDDGLVPAKHKTWSQWRGYGRVRVHEGAPGTKRSETEYRYFRGMHGDRLAAGGTKNVTVTDSEGTALTDLPHLRGFLREEIVRLGEGGTELEGTINDPWSHGPTATRVKDWGTMQAHMVETGRVRSRTALAGGKWRRTETVSDFDTDGLVTQVDDKGDVSDPADDTCLRTTYARNTATWMLDYESREEKVSVGCGVTPSRPGDVLNDQRTYFDGSATHGTPPTRGDETREEVLAEDGSYRTIARVTHDQHGRAVEIFNALGHRTTTAYTPATGGPVTKVTETNPAGHTEVTEVEPAWGDPVTTVDANGRRTDFVRDPLGRLVKVWLPGRDKATATPSMEYDYLVRNDGPDVVTTRTLNRTGDGYVSSYELLDGLLRPRQTQEPAPGGGRVISDTHYDDRGKAVKESGSYYNAEPPGTEVFLANDNELPGVAVTEYDAAGRPMGARFIARGGEQWSMTARHEGDRLHVSALEGGTATTQILDAHNRMVELRQYRGNDPEGDYDATRYTYTAGGDLASVTDPEGNVWRYHYDSLGRVVRQDDPDRGTSRIAYDVLDRVVSTTDARGSSVHNRYDVLGRVVSTHKDAPDGPALTSFTYDTVAKGHLSSATSHHNGAAYTRSVLAYSPTYQPARTALTVPAAEGALAGTYEQVTTFNPDGSTAATTEPAAGGLPAETIRYGYDELNQPLTLRGADDYVQETAYTKLGQTQRLVFGTGGPRTLRAFSYEEGTERLSRVITEREIAPVRVSDIRYTYDQSGNITRIADQPGGEQPSDVQCFLYDHLRRLTEAWTPGGGDCGAARSAGALGGAAPYWHSYDYDRLGNRTREVRHAAAGDTVRSYTYGKDGKPHALASVRTTGPGVDRTDTFGYDAGGNTVTRAVQGRQQALTWDAEGNLASVAENGRTTGYVYDAEGERLLRTDSGGVTLYLGGTELQLAAGKVTGTRYYTHAGQTVAVRTAKGVSWLLGDHQGSPQLAIDAATGQESRRRHLPFGESRGAEPADWPGERDFVGGKADEGTGLTQLGAREYDPLTGRFISVDAIITPTDPQQLNGYAYANNNPVTFEDANGLLFRCNWCRRTFSKYYRKVYRAVRRVYRTVRRVYRKVHRVVRRVYRKVRPFVRRLRWIPVVGYMHWNLRTGYRNARRAFTWYRRTIKKIFPPPAGRRGGQAAKPTLRRPPARQPARPPTKPPVSQGPSKPPIAIDENPDLNDWSGIPLGLAAAGGIAYSVVVGTGAAIGQGAAAGAAALRATGTGRSARQPVVRQRADEALEIDSTVDPWDLDAHAGRPEDPDPMLFETEGYRTGPRYKWLGALVVAIEAGAEIVNWYKSVRGS
ncbi:RHS repeat-associated core domain-containing protein [Nonomuraea sp. NPDC046802]|uniref:RHS repeat domain-containing protein n=1 Tax=Nonomuraea sp. NPDC046802 TaxID=3154919 RepID=UPI0033F8BE35